MKSGQYFFDCMSSELKIKWKAEWLTLSKGANLDYVMESNYRSFKHFMMNSFVWEESSQGHGFWSAISNKDID
jgi:hypothetical protein